MESQSTNTTAQLSDVAKLDQENQNLLELLQRGSLEENESLLKKLQQTRAEFEEVRSPKTDAGTFEMPEPAILLQKLRSIKAFKNSKVTLAEVEKLLELLEVGQ